MRTTLRLGRIAGIPVGLHWSVVGIVLLVAIGLAARQLPLLFPGYPVAAYVVAGIGAALLLVLSLLVHELAHAVVARRNGVEVAGITLWLLGGVAQLRGEARDAGAEARIAAVGPAASALLALLFAALASATAQFGAAALVAIVFVYLALLNAALAVFNLLPAAPLDGGRVLRAALWRWRGDRWRAAIWSAYAGRVLGLLLIGLGIAQLLFRGTNGLWWVLLGWFITAVAGAEAQQARVGAALADVPVRDVMRHPVPSAGPDTTLHGFLRDGLPTDPPPPAVVLLDPDGHVTGLLTPNRIRSVPEDARGTARLGELAVPADQLIRVRVEESLATVVPRLGDQRHAWILVEDAAGPVGVLTTSDVAEAVADRRLGAATFPVRVEGTGRRPSTPPSGWWFPGQRPPD
ncbi:site-2 protease family protein [Actinoalloteichus caeruleus]|uniref:Zinc metalloprotease n=1 Tax=Actinoalloteichus caeruleus DSM 43889 TaxID=1120930 RepID=A0ABT1JF25_ACTCY|nr:site-2 protease family protein [Actinoalloteichus caeruleus]MCP2331105.1 Zn-dependent protease (includes SpoIVFB) [Actinoalloteichus caeruleus DSM 43889]